MMNWCSVSWQSVYIYSNRWHKQLVIVWCHVAADLYVTQETSACLAHFQHLQINVYIRIYACSLRGGTSRPCQIKY